SQRGVLGGVDQGSQIGLGGLTRGDEGIHYTQLEPGQQVERTRYGRPGRRSRGELARVLRGRSGEIGTLAEQPGEPVVRPATELVGERSVRRPGLRSGHRDQVTGATGASGTGPMSRVELHYGA